VTTSVPARVGKPWVIDRTPQGLIHLSREMRNGFTTYMIFGSDEAIAVADGLVDFVETALADDGQKSRRLH
jgi:hypothetical protein